MKPIFLLSILLLSIPASAQSTIMPDSPLYGMKIWLQNVQETLTFDHGQKLLLKSEHLQERMSELKYMMENNKKTNTLVQEIQNKQSEMKEEISTVPHPECGNGDDRNICEDYLNKSQQTLTNLLNDPEMPEQSRKGLSNALNHTVHMPLGSIVPSTLPFKKVMVLNPDDQKWYSIVIEENSITFSNNLLSDYDYALYPNTEQIEELNKLSTDINNHGLTAEEEIKLVKLWYEIQKVKR